MENDVICIYLAGVLSNAPPLIIIVDWLCLQLCGRDQSVLLEEAWSGLFVLSAAQWFLPVDEG